LYSNDDESENPFQPVPSKKKMQQVKMTPKVNTGSSQDEDDLLQDHQSLQKPSNKAQEVKKPGRNNRAEDLPCKNTQLSKASDDASAKRPKPRPTKKASKTQGNNIPQAADGAEEAPRHGPAPTTMANKSETSRTTANNAVTVEMAPKNLKKPVSKMKPDSIAIRTANGSLSGDEDQKEREEMLASPVKGSDAQAASTVSQITLFDCIFYIPPSM
jgi:hypothetical protein